MATPTARNTSKLATANRSTGRDVLVEEGCRFMHEGYRQVQRPRQARCRETATER
jgi:hypothetical protein